MNNTRFTVRELSTYLKCSESLIRKMIREQSIPYFRLSTKILFSKEDIDVWVRQQTSY